MSADGFPSSPTDPAFVATVVGVIAAGGLFVAGELTAAVPPAETSAVVLLSVCLPAVVAYELAERLR